MLTPQHIALFSASAAERGRWLSHATFSGLEGTPNQRC
jgi:hypothetical protein